MKQRSAWRGPMAGIAAVCTAATTLTGCAGNGGSVTLTVYTGQHPQLMRDLAAAFEANTGVAVSMRQNDSIVLAQQLLQEGSSSRADVYIAENSPELTLLDEHHLLATLPASTRSQVPAEQSAPSGAWVGMAARVSGLAYNTGAITPSQLPASILDLAQPRWAGRLAVAPSDSDFVPVVGAVLARYGAATTSAWLAGLKHNAAIHQDVESVVSAVDRGDSDVGLINSYYWYRLRLEKGAASLHSAVHYFPGGDAGSVQNLAGAAVVAASPHAAEAREFVAFLVGLQGQEILAQGDDFEYPLRPGVAANPALPPLATVAAATVSVVALGDDQVAARLLQQAGLL